MHPLHEVQRDVEELVARADDKEYRLCGKTVIQGTRQNRHQAVQEQSTHGVVVPAEQPADVTLDLLVAPGARNERAGVRECSVLPGDMRVHAPVHVHIVTAEVECDKELERERVFGIRGREVAEQA